MTSDGAHQKMDRTDIEMAIELRQRGLTWRAIGIELTICRGRHVVFQGPSVGNACRPFMEEDPR